MMGNVTPLTPQQPGLRSFIVYNDLPDGCIAFEVPDDKTLPHVRAGEFVVIDPSDCDPAEGELFAITWKSDWRRKWQIVQMDLRQDRVRTGETFEERSLWWVGHVAAQELVGVDGEGDGRFQRRVDRPYEDDYLRDITHGKIVGIYEPDFRTRLAA